MRHGIMVEDSEDTTVCDNSGRVRCINGYELGCYFCNDVTAPGNVRILLKTVIQYFLMNNYFQT